MPSRVAAALVGTCLVTLLPWGGRAPAVSCGYPTSCPVAHLPIAMADEVEKGERTRIRVGMTADWEQTIDGRVKVTVTRSKGGFKWTRTKKFDGDPVRFRTPSLDKRGRHVVKARFKGSEDSDVEGAADYDDFRVVRPD